MKGMDSAVEKLKKSVFVLLRTIHRVKLERWFFCFLFFLLILGKWKLHYLSSWESWSMQYPGISPIQSGGGGGGGNQAGFSLGGGSPTSMDYPKGVECPDCGRHYKLKSSLRNHQKWECGKEPQFQCPYCNYRAKQKMHVARHIERMHREKLTMVESCMINNNSINNSNNNNNATIW